MSLFKRPRNETALVFEIGNGSVAGAVVGLPVGGVPTVIYAIREPIPFQERLAPTRLPSLVATAFDKACASIQKNGIPLAAKAGFPAKLGKAFFIFCPPWYLSESKILTIENIKPFLFTRELAEAAVSKEAESFKKNENVASSDSVLLDKAVTAVSFEGYQIANPYGKRAVKAEFSAFISFIPKEIEKTAGDIALKYFSPREIISTAASLMLHRVLSAASEEQEFLIVDVSRELTEITLSKKGAIRESASFPVGKNHLIRAAMRDLKSNPEVAASWIALHGKDLLADGHAEMATASLDRARAKWASELRDTFTNLSATHYLPKKIFLTCQKEHSELFKTAILEATKDESSFGDEPREIELLSKAHLDGLIQAADIEADAFLLAGAAYAGERFRDSDLRV